MSNIQLHVGGVPEHFNVPWWEAQAHGEFNKLGIEIIWHECAGGTGQMVKALSNKELDLAISLTEGTVAAINQEAPISLVQWYVSSPLLWGIHVAANSHFQTTEQLKQARVAISRPGSGSHLMSYVEAQRQGWLSHTPNQSTNNQAIANQQDSPFEFVEVKHLQGGIEALRDKRADVFLWERFTTQPYVDQGLLRRVGICPTPWPAFVISANNQLSDEQQIAVGHVCRLISHQAPKLKSDPKVVRIIQKYCQLETEEIKEWLQLTEWADSESCIIQQEQLDDVLQTLKRLGLIQKKLPSSAYLL